MTVKIFAVKYTLNETLLRGEMRFENVIVGDLEVNKLECLPWFY